MSVRGPILNPGIRQRARELRHNATEAEQLLWECLRSRRLAGFKFRRQTPIGRYIVDFCCVEARLIVELDGGQHQDQQGYDAARDAWLRERGFNQALALAQLVCRRRGWPLWWTLLERTRATRAQVGLEAVERWRNVKGAFAVRDPNGVEGKRVVLLDDVLTTGSTVNECARVLKRAGATSVAVLAVARQLRPA